MYDKAIIVVSFEDYTVNLGGVNKVILAHQEILISHGYKVIFICPCHIAKGLLGKEKWLVRVNGELQMIEDQNGVASFCRSFYVKGIQIHHLKNINIIQLESILNKVDADIFFYLHDYSTIIPDGNGTLLRENNTLYDYEHFDVDDYKNSPFYKKAKDIRLFFSEYSDRMKFIAPSDACKEIWSSVYPEYRDKIIVIYHQKEVGEYRRPQIQNEKIRVAFVGKQSSVKGWDIFEKVIETQKNNNLIYEFYSCGEDREQLEYVKNIKVDFHIGLDAMTQALRDQRIDIVLLLSICPETYSYTYYESKAADTYMLALANSGNIAAQIINVGNGKIFDDKEQLISYLNNAEVVKQDLKQFRESVHMAPKSLIENDEFLALFSSKQFASSTDSRYTPGIISRVLCAIYNTQEQIKSVLK